METTSGILNIELEEAALGRWPRRLLHVPTMTSYEWQPGNKYGGHIAPGYNAMTYTWGRWRIPQNESPHIRPINIHGIPWEVPRVSTDCFTSDQLVTVLQRASGKVLINSTGLSDLEYVPEVEFIWLDIACIDQRENEPRSSAEVGRQAVIFKGANSVFVWLSSIPIEALNSAIATLDRVFEREIYEYALYVATDFSDALKFFFQKTPLVAVYDSLSVILSDPWFTSLWTLQEALLRQDAVWTSREGIAATLPELSLTGTPFNATISEMVQFCGVFASQEIRAVGGPEPYDRIIQLIDTSGMTAIATLNPLSIYAASDHRTSTKDEDRIYGIQQVFGFRLGKSASRCFRSFFHRSELEILLGEQLLLNNPILSQSHCFTTPAPIGKGWLVNTKSIVPSDIPGETVNDIWTSAVETPRCKLSVRNVQRMVWGHFEAHLCDFSTLYPRCISFEKRMGSQFTIMGDDNYIVIHLDATPELPNCPEQTGPDYEQVPHGPRQRALGDWLYEEHGDELQVMLLGSREFNMTDAGPSIGGKFMMGVLMLPGDNQEIKYYRRVGFCWWDVNLTRHHDIESLDLQLLNGDGSQWDLKFGLFG